MVLILLRSARSPRRTGPQLVNREPGVVRGRGWCYFPSCASCAAVPHPQPEPHTLLFYSKIFHLHAAEMLQNLNPEQDTRETANDTETLTRGKAAHWKRTGTQANQGTRTHHGRSTKISTQLGQDTHSEGARHRTRPQRGRLTETKGK